MKMTVPHNSICFSRRQILRTSALGLPALVFAKHMTQAYAQTDLSEIEISQTDKLQAHIGQAQGGPEVMRAAISDMFGESEIKTGRVALKIPPISENGYSVSVDIDVESQMSAQNYVKRVALFSPRNPVPLIAQYQFSPQSGRARIRTQVRLAGTQTVHAIAEFSDGTLWRGTASPLVTIAACIIF